MNSKISVSILNAGGQAHYLYGLITGLTKINNLNIEVVDAIRSQDLFKNEDIKFYALRGNQNQSVPLKQKISRIILYYCRLIRYAYKTESKIFHIQWLNKFIHFDRTFLNIYYKILGKKLVFTAHNIDADERDGRSSLINRISLKFMYKIVDHIIVHTKKMEQSLSENFNIRKAKVTVIPHGINNAISNSELTGIQARKLLKLESNHKILLFFGNIAPYKGVENLVVSLADLKEKYSDIRLIIAGNVKKMCHAYWTSIEKLIEKYRLMEYIIKRIGWIPDKEVEVYFKAADALIFPYNEIFQTGVSFLSYNFGLPIVATDVGSLREDIIEGVTGFICRKGDPQDLSKKIEMYFKSDLFRQLEVNRRKIIRYANEKYSWDMIGKKTYAVYTRRLEL